MKKQQAVSLRVLKHKSIAAVKKMIEGDNKTTYAVIEHQNKIGSSTFKTIMHDRLHLKKVLSRSVPHHLSDFQKSERVTNGHET